MLAGSRLLHARATKIVPHVVDTLLLSALALVSIVGFGANAAWLSAKIAGLVSTSCSARSRSSSSAAARSARAVFGVFAFIASVARTHDPAGFLHRVI